MRTFDRIVYGLLAVLVAGLFLSASAQVTPTIPNPSRVYGARMQGFTSHPAIGYEFFDATGTTNSHRYAYLRQQGGMVLSSSLSITNGRGGATTGHWDKDGSITVTGCTGCGGAPDPLTANGWTPASGTGTFTGIYKLAATGTGVATDTYISRDLSNNFVINAPTTGGFYALNGNSASFFSGPSGGGNRAVISGNGASDGLVVGGSLVINGQGSIVNVNALTASGPSSIGAATVSTLHATGTITADGDINAGGGTVDASAILAEDSLTSVGFADLSGGASVAGSGLSVGTGGYTQTAGPTAVSIQSKTATYTITTTETPYFMMASGCSSSQTISLPGSPGTGETHYVKSRCTNSFTLSGNGKNIDGSASLSIVTNESVMVVYSGSEWIVMLSNNGAIL